MTGKELAQQLNREASGRSRQAEEARAQLRREIDELHREVLANSPRRASIDRLNIYAIYNAQNGVRS